MCAYRVKEVFENLYFCLSRSQLLYHWMLVMVK